MTTDKCVILVPYIAHIEPSTERSLRQLEDVGYKVHRVHGYSCIDAARNQMATDALLQGFEELIWIDSDIGFSLDAIEQLRSSGLAIVAGLYVKKGRRSLACSLLPGEDRLQCGAAGSVIEIRYAAAGFLYTRGQVYTDIQAKLQMPVCNRRFGRPMIPFFQPLIIDDDGEPWYLAEDFAFCHRARQCGYAVFADTRIRLLHFGTYGYTWEDAGRDPRRYESYCYRIPSLSAHGDDEK